MQYTIRRPFGGGRGNYWRAGGLFDPSNHDGSATNEAVTTPSTTNEQGSANEVHAGGCGHHIQGGKRSFVGTGYNSTPIQDGSAKSCSYKPNSIRYP